MISIAIEKKVQLHNDLTTVENSEPVQFNLKEKNKFALSSSNQNGDSTKMLDDDMHEIMNDSNINSEEAVIVRYYSSDCQQLPSVKENDSTNCASYHASQLDSSNDNSKNKISNCGDMKCDNSCEISKDHSKGCDEGIKSELDDAVANRELTEFPKIDMKPKTTKPRQDTIVEWNDDQHQTDMIHCLNVFRKSKKFCDLVILVSSQELFCHRVVVGGASRAVLDALCRGESESGAIARIAVDTRKARLSPIAVEILIDYMYTSKLSFAPEHLTSVYCAALQLAVERVIQVCRRHVIDSIDTDQCIEMRRLAQNYGDSEMKNFIDGFIEENFEAIGCGEEFLSLPRIKVEIITSPNPGVAISLLINSKPGFLSSNTLNWISNLIKQKGGRYLEDLTEQIQCIPIEELNNTTTFSNQNYLRRTLQEVEPRSLVEGPILNRVRLARTSSMDSIDSSDLSDSTTRQRCFPTGEWKVIASMHSAETEHTISLCCVGGVLCALSIRVPNLTNGDMNNYTNGIVADQTNNTHFSSGSSSSASCSSSVGSGSQHPPMKQPRSAAGAAQIDGRLIVAGGFNQSKSLDTVECLNIALGRWSALPRMGEKRGRFSVAVLDGQLYAVGGSTGSCDLQSVERYDPVNNAWTYVQPLLFCCSESGVAVVGGLLYCVGGVQQNTGIAGLKYCQVYDPSLDQWEYRASTRIARRSLGVASLGGHLYAVGGSDGWKCLSSVERYDPTTDQWSFAASLNIPRRGSGLVEHNGSLYCVGGSDGQSFLASVECYNCVDGDLWTLTSWTLTVPRSNAGLVSLNGCVFVVGGFSGRQFLSSVELIEDNPAEWTNQDALGFRNGTGGSKDSSSSGNE